MSQITGLDSKIQEMAARIRELRETEGRTAEEMALATDVSVDDYVALLSGVAGKLSLSVLSRFIVYAAHVKRLRYPVLEGVGQVVVGHSVGLGDLLTSAGARHGVLAQVGAVSLDDVSYVYVESVCASVNKCEVKVSGT